MKNITTELSLGFLALCFAGAAFVSPARAVDKDTAAAYATSAEVSAKDGKNETAKELCYSALALDENCPTALFELGKIFEREGNNVAAADFLVRASREFSKNETNKDWGLKRSDADARIKHLNEFAPRFTSLMADYSQELNGITKKSLDSMTLEEACDRADALNLRAILPPDKAPKFEREAPKIKATSPGPKTSRDPDEMIGMRPVKKETVTNVPIDVERALKKAGFETITGVWKKKAENVYEVTDGKLESAKMIGSLQVTVDKGGTGSVKVMVRNSFRQYAGYSSSITRAYTYGTGFGFTVQGGEAKMYTPYSMMMTTAASSMHPYMEREIPMVGEKTYYRVTIEESKIEYYAGAKREKIAPYKLPKEGPFVIEIDGTMTIEDPRTIGQ